MIVTDNEIISFAARALNNGMIANSKGSRGCQIRGIVPADEAKVIKEEQITPYSFKYIMQYDEDLMEFSKRVPPRGKPYP